MQDVVKLTRDFEGFEIGPNELISRSVSEYTSLEEYPELEGMIVSKSLERDYTLSFAQVTKSPKWMNLKTGSISESNSPKSKRKGVLLFGNGGSRGLK